MSVDGQGTKCRRNIAEHFNRLSRAHERYRQTDDRQATDGRAMAYSERELTFTFAKNGLSNSRKQLNKLILCQNACYFGRASHRRDKTRLSEAESKVTLWSTLYMQRADSFQ